MGSGKILGAGVVLGIVAGVFFSYPLGLNIVLYLLCVFIVGVIVLASSHRRILTINTIFALPTLFFAIMLMLGTNNVLNTINTIVMCGSLLLLIFFHDDPRLLGGSWRSVLVTLYYALSMEWLTSPFILLRDATMPLLERANYRSTSPIQSVIRGFVISVPVVLMAGGLLNAADLVFQQKLANATNWIAAPHWSAVLISTMIGGVTFWLSIALLRVLDWDSSSPDDLVEPQIRRRGLFRVRLGKLELSVQAITAWIGSRLRRLLRLSVIESGIIMGSVALLFVGFVIIQFDYFFGGTSNIGIEAYTYSGYARRGFFEAMAAVGVVTVLILALQSMTRHHSDRDWQLFRGLATLLTISSTPMIVSAVLRLTAYESVYGLTHARLLAFIVTGCLPIILGMLLIHLFSPQQHIFQGGILVLAILLLVLLNLIRMDERIAQRNIAHFRESGTLDSVYLLTLSDDAVPSLLDFVAELDPTSPHRPIIVNHLSHRLTTLDRDQDQRDVLGYHYGKTRAWKALDQQRDLLETNQ